MKPSRKISLGIAILVTGVLLKSATSLMARHLVSLANQLSTDDTAAAMKTHAQMEQTSWMLETVKYGTPAANLLALVGVFLICLGAYQNAKTTEQLLESLAKQQAPTQIP